MISRDHACGSLALSRGKTLNVFLAKLFFRLSTSSSYLADLAHCLHVAVLSRVNGILEGF